MVGVHLPASDQHNLSYHTFVSAAKACFCHACTYPTRFAGEAALSEPNVFLRGGCVAGASHRPRRPYLLKTRRSHTYLATPASSSKPVSATTQFDLEFILGSFRCHPYHVRRLYEHPRVAFN